jgi:predicted DNA-binding transcriptional regulator AlpA
MDSPVPLKTYLTGPQVKARYGCSYQTIWRWMNAPGMEFPKPLKINNRNRFALDEIEAFERKQKTPKTAEAA